MIVRDVVETDVVLPTVLLLSTTLTNVYPVLNLVRCMTYRFIPTAVGAELLIFHSRICE